MGPGGVGREIVFFNGKKEEGWFFWEGGWKGGRWGLVRFGEGGGRGEERGRGSRGGGVGGGGRRGGGGGSDDGITNMSLSI